MAPDAGVRCGDEVVVLFVPCVEHASDGRWSEIRTVGKHDDRRFGGLWEGRQAATQRRAGPALPVGAVHESSVRLERMRSRDYDDLIDRRLSKTREYLRHEQLLLRSPESRRLTRREHDGSDDAHQSSTTETFSTSTVWVGCSAASPSSPMRSTTARSSPSTVPTTA